MSTRRYTRPSPLSVALPPADDGLLDRRCDARDCARLFRVPWQQPDATRMLHCPYCGHTAPDDDFYTQEQIVYAYAMTDECGPFSRSVLRERGEASTDAIADAIQVALDGPVPTPFAAPPTSDARYPACTRCRTRFAVWGNAMYCPLCGDAT